MEARLHYIDAAGQLYRLRGSLIHNRLPLSPPFCIQGRSAPVVQIKMNSTRAESSGNSFGNNLKATTISRS